MGAQGDVMFRKVPTGVLPEGVKDAPVEVPGKVVVAHSETGHHHFLEAVPGVRHYVSSDPLIAYLSLDEASDVVHARPYDTHQTVTLDPGVWEVRRQREYVPGSHRRVED